MGSGWGEGASGRRLEDIWELSLLDWREERMESVEVEDDGVGVGEGVWAPKEDCRFDLDFGFGSDSGSGCGSGASSSGNNAGMLPSSINIAQKCVPSSSNEGHWNETFGFVCRLVDACLELYRLDRTRGNQYELFTHPHVIYSLTA